tara:strand:- start:179 stop:1156 length:978 start_codon:yes stop_codon:yes gene_type:complete
MIRKSSILITGAGGEVGSELIHTLSQNENVNIVTLDLHPLESQAADKVADKITGNILDINLLDQINLEFEIKEIYHLAAILSTRAELSPRIAHDVNVNGTINMLELALKQSKSQNKKIKFFFPSSIAVYGVNDKQQICSESDYLNPMTVYGANKLYAEKLGIYYSQYYDQLSDNKYFIDFRSLRFPGLISASTIPSGGTSDFIPEMWHSIKNENSYECFVNEKSRLPFLAMPDAIKAINQMMSSKSEKIQSRIYNVTSFNPSASDFFQLMIELYPTAKISYNINEVRQKIVDSWPSNIDDSLAKDEWGWAPDYNLKKTINEYLKS